MDNKKAHINIVVIGHYNSGKSTTMGHMLYKLGEVKEEVIEGYEREAAEMGKRSFKYAWVVDKLKTERERGKTIDISRSGFESPRYICTVINAPGHRDYVKNMITGTSQADCALLIIDSTYPAFEYGISDGQTREHALIAFILGVKQLICCCNKMDATTPEYCETRFNKIVKELSSFLRTVGFNPKKVQFVPISGFKGENMTEKSSYLDWYEGPTLLEAIDQINEPIRLVDKPFRLPVSDVYNIGGFATVAVGRVVTGFIGPGVKVYVAPSGISTELMDIQMHLNNTYDVVKPGDSVGLVFDYRGPGEHQSIARGDVVSILKQRLAQRVDSFTAHVIVLNHPGHIKEGYTPIVCCHTACVAVRFNKLLHRIDRVTFEAFHPLPKFLKNGDAGMVEMVPVKPMVVETFSKFPELGRFVVRDLQRTVAVGMIKSVKYSERM